MKPKPSIIACKMCGKQFQSKRRTTCSEACHHKALKTAQTERKYRRATILNAFLPPDAEENVHAFWVPSPQEIEAECEKIRLSWTDHDHRVRNMPCHYERA